MPDDALTFAEWIDFEASRIVNLGLLTPSEHCADYMRIQIEAALKKAFAHGHDGLSVDDLPRTISN